MHGTVCVGVNDDVGDGTVNENDTHQQKQKFCISKFRIIQKLLTISPILLFIHLILSLILTVTLALVLRMLAF